MTAIIRGGVNRNFGLKGLLLAALAAAPISGAYAQSANPIEYCRQTSPDKDSRIACLESAITGLAEQQSIAGDGSAPAAGAVMRTARNSASPSQDGPTGLGAEQVAANKANKEKRDEEQDERVVLKIADFKFTPYGKAILTMEDGQVWRQNPSDGQRLRLKKSESYSAEIRRGVVSGYRLKIIETSKNIVVTRVK